MDRLDAILTRMLALHPQEIDLSLGRVERLLAAMGYPDRRLPPVIHVAGTNGKGSVSAFLRAMLEADGRRVHVYSSPHLVRFNERIRVGGPDGSEFVDDDLLVEALLEVERINAGEPITQFEITTATAMLIFAAAPADFVILEVGLGGRLDATNVIQDPLATIITPVSIDHERFLGDTIAGIAAEKAGIVKYGQPLIVGHQPDEALTVIESIAARKHAPIAIANRDWQAYPEHGRLVFLDSDGLLDLPPPRLVGRHQFSNAGTAIAALRHARIDISPAAIERGLLSADWPARMQRLTDGRIVSLFADRIAEIWLDGGHNPGSSVVIAEVLADLQERSPRPLDLVVGMTETKNIDGFLRPFAGLVRSMVAVSIDGHASHPPEDLVAAASELGIRAREAESVHEALRQLADPPGARVLICGSLFLAGNLLSENGTPPK